MDKSPSVTCLLYSDVVKGDTSPTWLRKYQEEDEEEAMKREFKESEIFVSKNFTAFFCLFFFQLLYFIIFSILFLPTTLLPPPTTSTHCPRPATFCYTVNLKSQMWADG